MIKGAFRGRIGDKELLGIRRSNKAVAPMHNVAHSVVQGGVDMKVWMREGWGGLQWINYGTLIKSE